MKSVNKSFVRFVTRSVAAGATALVVGGCAVGGVPLFKKLDSKPDSQATAEETLPDIHPMRKERATAAAKRFDQERNGAEYQAASAEWRQGNFKACREGLDKILRREPAHRDSLILLAELDLEQDRPEAAVDGLRRGVAAHPEDAEMAYKLGLALEAAGDESEALHHFHVATQLAPHEKKYAELYQHAEQHARGAVESEEAVKNEAATRPDVFTQRIGTAGNPNIQLASNEAPAADLAESPTTAESEVGAKVAEPAAGEPLETESVAADSDAIPAHAAKPQAGEQPAAEPLSMVEQARPVAADLSAIESAAADWDAGRKANCIKTIDAILARDPKHVEANILQVEIDLAAGRNDEARARIERLAICNPHSAQVRRACALAYEALGDAARAESAFAMAEALELGAIEDATPRSQLAREERIRMVGDAQPVSTNTLSIQPVSSAPSIPDVAEAAKPNELSVDEFAPALPILGPTDDAPIQPETSRTKVRLTAQQHLEKGEVLLKAGKHADAERELRAVISAKSCVVKTAAAAAIAPLKYEQSELALSLAKEGLKKYPDSAGLHRIEGTAALRLGRHLEAEAALRQSLNLDNSQALTYFLLGSVYDRLGNKEAATRHLSHASRLDGRYATRK